MPAGPSLISPARRRFAVSLLAGAALAILPNIPGATPPPVHIAMTLTAGTTWLDRLNQWRASTGLSALTENPTWSVGDYDHAFYMVKNGLVTHYETPGVPFYTVAGDTEARNSNIQVSSSTSTTDDQIIDWWMAAPFHAMAMMDPRLTQTGFGSYRDTTTSPWQEGGALDTLQGNSFSGGSYPVYFPGNGSTEPLTTYGGGEFPNPLQACPGYSAPTGLPLFIQVGGNVNTSAGAHAFTGNGVQLAHCVIDSSNSAVSSYLYTRGGVILVPQQPLQSGVKYVVNLTVNGTAYGWSFTVGAFWGVTGVTPTFGPPAGATAVTITGSGFTGATSVKFGTTAATSFTVVNDTTITAVSPAHALGLVDVTVTTPKGTSAMLSGDQFAYATPCTAVTLTATPPSPSGSGTQVMFTASSTCPDAAPLYEFWAKWQGYSTWQLLQGYSTSNVYHWNSTGALGGTESIGIWVRDATSPGITASDIGRFDSNLSLPYTVTTGHCTSVTVTAAPAPPVASGTPVTLTGAAVGCANPVYEFWARWQGYSTWQLLQGYSTSNVYHWNSTGAAAGTEYFGIWAEDASSGATSTYDANASIPYSVTTQTCGSVTVSANPTTVVHGTGTHVTITGVAAGCTPRYEFWLRTTTTGWQLVQAYSTTATYDWNTTGAPVTTVYIGVWAKDAASSTGSFDANASVAIPVT